MTKKIVFGVAVVALAVLVMVPSASANCGSARTASTFQGSGISYWNSSAANQAETPTAIGKSWQLGAPAAWNADGGTVPCVKSGTSPQSFFYFSGGLGNLNLDLASCGAGCPATGSTLAVLAQSQGTTNTEFLVATVVETPAGAVNFDYGPQGTHAMIPIPCPRVTASSRTGSVVNLTVQFDSIAGGFYGPNAATSVSGFRLLTRSLATDPGRNAASYDAVPAATVVSPGGAQTTTGVAVNCTNPADQWLVTQIAFEGGQVLSNAVSCATRVACDPAVANPKYKTVPKRIGTPLSNPN